MSYKYRRVVATVVIFLIMAVIFLLAHAGQPVLWTTLIAGIVEIFNDLRG